MMMVVTACERHTGPEHTVQLLVGLHAEDNGDDNDDDEDDDAATAMSSALSIWDGETATTTRRFKLINETENCLERVPSEAWSHSASALSARILEGAPAFAK